jgi:RHS repeat-associated protein
VALQFDGPAASDLSHRYLWNPAAVDQLLADEAVTSLSSAGNVLWPLTDHLGTIRDLVTHSGTTTIANHRQYDSFGNLISETNAAIDELFGFTGRLWDEATKLQNNLNRWYDPATGRWLSEDPIGFIGGDTNLGRYVHNSPTNRIDPDGLEETIAGQFGWGLLQGGANIVNGLQDSAIGMGNMYTHSFAGVNQFEFWSGQDLSVPSPDWSKGWLTGESDFCHDASKFIGAAGVEALAGVGIAKASKLRFAANVGRSGARRSGPVRVTRPQQYQQQQGNGSYTNTHQSGKTYSGKGEGSRMNKSAARIANKHSDPVVDKDYSSAPDATQSFIDEQCRVEANGGPGGNTYNKINSPGKKLRDGS